MHAHLIKELVPSSEHRKGYWHPWWKPVPVTAGPAYVYRVWHDKCILCKGKIKGLTLIQQNDVFRDAFYQIGCEWNLSSDVLKTLHAS